MNDRDHADQIRQQIERRNALDHSVESREAKLAFVKQLYAPYPLGHMLSVYQDKNVQMAAE